MRTIWKYPVSIGRPFNLAMPTGAIVRHVDMQGHDSNLWAEVESDATPETRRFVVFGTGHEVMRGDMGCDVRYVATWQEPPFVWHLYEICGV